MSAEPSTPIFVFGSNLAGRHGKGAALWARQHRGAIYGQGSGRQGNSYAIPTKDATLRTLPLTTIAFPHVWSFIEYAKMHEGTSFQLTPIGCGLAGYTPAQIAPMFKDAPPNVILPDEFKAVLAHPPSGVTAPDGEVGGLSVAESGSTASPKSDSACQSEGGA